MTIEPMISIGLPVYNGSKFIQKRLDSILNQTITKFELIISDNASTDSTSSICEEYLQRDKRIRYIRQEKNMGAWWNFNFVLRQAKNDFFSWAAVDDLWNPDFLEKNVNVLLSNVNIVGSISKVKPYTINELKADKIDSSFQNFMRMVRFSLKPSGVYSISGTYQNKVRNFLKKGYPDMVYGVYRTDKLQKSFMNESFVGNGYAIILSVLQHGDFFVLDETLMSKYDQGFSSTLK